MINPKFTLRNSKAKGVTSIKFYFYYQSQRFTYSLGSSRAIYPDLWDNDSMRPTKDRTSIKRLKRLNPNVEIELSNVESRINNIITKTKQYFSNVEIQGNTVDFGDLKAFLDKFFCAEPKRAEKSLDDDLEQYLEHFILGITNGSILIESKTGARQYSSATVRAYKVLQTKLKEYRELNSKKYLKFDHIDSSFYINFRKWFNDQNYTANHFGNVIKNLKAIMKRSYDQNYHTNIYPMTSAFKKTSSESITVYLTKKELDQLINYNLSDRLHLDRLRDIFVVGTMIAQRYGDYSDIDQSNIHVDDHGKKTIRLIQNKGRNKVIVPMSGVVERVLSKYENKLPKSNVNSLNYAIKDICKELGITQTIEVMENRGGKEVIRNVQKYELVGSHTARRTGCTLMYLNGIPTIDIMKISGHKTESELLKYIRVTKEETAQRLSLNPFFNSSLKVV